MQYTALPAPAFCSARESRASTAPDAVRAALLAFARAPGRFPLALREPAILFERLGDVLQLAVRRNDAVPGDSAHAEAADAALLFIGAALLAPGRGHYALFGAPAGSLPSDLRHRYRLLIRLTHPDFARDREASWSQDAASRVNLAYEVLSSPPLRQRYDEELATGAWSSPGPSTRARPVRCEREGARFTWPASKRSVVVTMACVLAAAALGVLLLPDKNAVQIIERKDMQVACAQETDPFAAQSGRCAAADADTSPRPLSLHRTPTLARR